jgi:hypothetical protein
MDLDRWSLRRRMTDNTVRKAHISEAREQMQPQGHPEKAFLDPKQHGEGFRKLMGPAS